MTTTIQFGAKPNRAQLELASIASDIQMNDAIFDNWDHDDHSPQAAYDLERLGDKRRALIADYERISGLKYPERGPQ